ncbi:MAG: large conductance mechanosensitive channel protein MscL [Candidatus Aminicenantes bacterium]|nr:large conductance mechanosensitive channel protein MscL [Candidatus Aminicenantes bacterium]
MLKEFKEFALRGNVIDMAVGIIIGAAFGAMVNSLVVDVIMPPIGLWLGKVDFSNFYLVLKEGTPAGPYASLKAAKDAGAVTWNIGVFLNTIISFLIVALAIFLIIRQINKLRRQVEAPAAVPTTKNCPYCFSSIHFQATRCPYCTSSLS